METIANNAQQTSARLERRRGSSRAVSAVRIHYPEEATFPLASGWVVALLLPLLVVWIGSRHPSTVRWEVEIAHGETVLDFAGPEPEVSVELAAASVAQPVVSPALTEPEPAIPEAAVPPSAATPPPAPAIARSAPRTSATAKAAPARGPVTSKSTSSAAGGVSGAARRNASLMRSPLPPYPAAARAAEFEGRVLLRVQVGTDGRPRAAAVERSSGRADCDQAARETVLRSWSFRPALEGGRPVEVSLTLAVRFSLDA